MDYTKILSALSRAKDALEKKIDAVNTSVSGLPGTLDTQFTEVKNAIATVKTDVAGVKSDVAGVRGGVDTTLQRLTALDGKVNPWDLQPNVIVRKLDYTENGVILNVYGKGKLLCVGNMNTDEYCDIEVNMDAKKELNINYRSNSRYGGCYVCQSYIRAKDGIKIITSFGDIMLNHEKSEFIAGEDEFSYMNSESTFFTSYKPIAFNTNLTIEVKSKGNIRKSTCLIAYTLD